MCKSGLCSLLGGKGTRTSRGLGKVYFLTWEAETRIYLVTVNFCSMYSNGRAPFF